MSWIICLILSAAVIAAAIVLAVYVAKHKKANKIFKPFYILFGGVAVSAALLYVPLQIQRFELNFDGGIKTFFISIQNAVQMFTVDADFSELNGAIAINSDFWTMIYSCFAAAMFVVAPVFTAGFVLSFFKNISAYARLFLARSKDLYIFSELNDKSLVLARDIMKNHPKCAVIFTDVFPDNDEGTYEILEEAHEIGAICFKKDILVLNLKSHNKDKALYFFTIGEDETENIDQSLKLIKMYSELENTHLFVFSTRIESEMLLTNAGKGNMKVRRINEVRSLVNRILFENGKEFFDNALPDGYGKKTVSGIVVGMGRHGTEMVKALSWFGQMEGYNIEIDAFDMDPLAKDKFTALCPELMSPVYNGTHIEGESEYSIVIHSGYNVDTKSFADEISKLDHATYVLVALGTDEDNIKCAVNIRMLFERVGIKPVIQTIIYNSDQKNALQGISNYRGQAYNIDFIGDLESSYTENVIIDSELEADALRRHMKWGKEEEFWQYEYNYRSSLASAIHIKTRIALGIKGADKKEEELTEEERDLIEHLEHRRWNTYMRSEGYVYSGNPDKSSRNDLGKMHHDLVDFASLSEEDKRKDSRVGTN